MMTIRKPAAKRKAILKREPPMPRWMKEGLEKGRLRLEQEFRRIEKEIFGALPPTKH